ncbi:1589_t:CDS:2 [Cetraspora pellucida]|uniref:1589_t:CDS:1 n=1 Tax=Cetraspora pellucida TaxID=1433469 RepID=A0ACA9LF77_9GLOM|nr:1589_t:CDS:2 [Cetraspora pellucida]
MKSLIYQSFQREFANNHSDCLELAFVYLLKCYYFPKYLRPEYWQETTKNLPDNYDEKINSYLSYYNDYCYKGIISSEFIKGVVEFMPVHEALDDCLIEIKWTDQVEIKEEYLEKLIDYTDNYDFPTIKKIGVYFAKQGKLLICPLNKCSHDITINDFQEKRAQQYRIGQGIFLEA